MNQFSSEEQEIIKPFEDGEWITQGTNDQFSVNLVIKSLKL